MKSTLERIQNEWQHFCTHPSFVFTRVWNVERLQLPGGRQKSLLALPYLGAQWLGQFSHSIFKGLIFSKQLLGTQPHPQQCGDQCLWADERKLVSQLYTHWPSPTWSLTPQQCPHSHRVLQLSSSSPPSTIHCPTPCYTDIDPFWFVFVPFLIICIVEISNHAQIFFNCQRRKLFKNKL